MIQYWNLSCVSSGFFSFCSPSHPAEQTDHPQSYLCKEPDPSTVDDTTSNSNSNSNFIRTRESLTSVTLAIMGGHRKLSSGASTARISRRGQNSLLPIVICSTRLSSVSLSDTSAMLMLMLVLLSEQVTCSILCVFKGHVMRNSWRGSEFEIYPKTPKCSF